MYLNERGRLSWRPLSFGLPAPVPLVGVGNVVVGRRTVLIGQNILIDFELLNKRSISFTPILPLTISRKLASLAKMPFVSSRSSSIFLFIFLGRTPKGRVVGWPLLHIRLQLRSANAPKLFQWPILV